ncbi:hypothetical protein, partial [Zhongshania sp.]|uniref:hypothetical protein n=1 Tax=Zhongshania sp. TaxID=1971902 RepID=UPI003567D384
GAKSKLLGIVRLCTPITTIKNEVEVRRGGLTLSTILSVNVKRGRMASYGRGLRPEYIAYIER